MATGASPVPGVDADAHLAHPGRFPDDESQAAADSPRTSALSLREGVTDTMLSDHYRIPARRSEVATAAAPNHQALEALGSAVPGTVTRLISDRRAIISPADVGPGTGTIDVSDEDLRATADWLRSSPGTRRRWLDTRARSREGALPRSRLWAVVIVVVTINLLVAWIAMNAGAYAIVLLNVLVGATAVAYAIWSRAGDKVAPVNDDPAAPTRLRLLVERFEAGRDATEPSVIVVDAWDPYEAELESTCAAALELSGRFGAPAICLVTAAGEGPRETTTEAVAAIEGSRVHRVIELDA